MSMQHPTVIEDLPAEGELLTEVQLRLVHGGMNSVSKTINVEVGHTDVDDAF